MLMKTWRSFAAPQRAAALLLTTALVTTVTAPQKALANTGELCVPGIIDVARNDAVCPALSLVRHIFTGDDQGRLRPNRAISRAEMIKVLVVLKGLDPQPNADLPFNDISGHWVATQGYVQAAYAAGIVEGYPDGSFRPDARVSRAEAVTMIVKAFGLTIATPPYADVSPTAWYTGWVGAGYAARIIDHPEFTAYSDIDFQPDRAMLRGEAVEVVAATYYLYVGQGPNCTGQFVPVEKKFDYWDWKWPFNHTVTVSWQFDQSCGQWGNYNINKS